MLIHISEEANYFFLGQRRHLVCNIYLTFTTPYMISLYPPTYLASTRESNKVHQGMLKFISVLSLEKWKKIVQPCFISHVFLLFVLIPMDSSHLLFYHLFLKTQSQKGYSTLYATSHLNTVWAPSVGHLETTPAVPSQEKYIRLGLFSRSSWEIRYANPFSIVIEQTMKLTLTHRTLLQEWNF